MLKQYDGNAVGVAARKFAHALLDNESFSTLIPPTQDHAGFWFGGGNIVFHNGTFLLIGRYRDAGDSRYGTEKGRRGFKVSVYASKTFDSEWVEVATVRKPENVLSFEGTALFVSAEGRIHAYVSSEKKKKYPTEVAAYQKSGTGIWSIDEYEFNADAKTLKLLRESVISSEDPVYLHVKDPNVTKMNGETVVFFASSPFSWTSTSTGLYSASETKFGVLPGGITWDVAVSRLTCRVPIPISSKRAVSLYFYDGAECVHDHERPKESESDAKSLKKSAVVKKSPPRGHSCEEVGGICVGYDDEFPRMKRVSVLRPEFWSPSGTGSSRYVSVLAHGDSYYVIWQRSNSNGAQPLVGRVVGKFDVLKALHGVENRKT